MIAELFLSTALLVALTFAVARGVEALLPEGVPWLITQAVVSALMLWALSALLFAGLYMLEAPQAAKLIGTGGWGRFAALGLKAGLVWAPILILVVSTAPSRWKTAVW